LKNVLIPWPFLPSIIVMFLNIDFVVIPFLKNKGLNIWELFFISSFLATLELGYWYWFWGWLIKTIKTVGPIKDSIAFGKEIGRDLKRQGLLERIKEFFLKKYSWATDHNNRVLKWIRRGGHISLILAGVMPEPGTRTIGVIFCRTLKSKLGFVSLSFGNVLHIGYMVGLWEFIFRLFK